MSYLLLNGAEIGANYCDLSYSYWFWWVSESAKTNHMEDGLWLPTICEAVEVSGSLYIPMNLKYRLNHEVVKCILKELNYTKLLNL